MMVMLHEMLIGNSKSFEFDNMFSYGNGSKIDFTKLNGVAGIVAPNIQVNLL